jgi:hypothetical protein
MPEPFVFPALGFAFPYVSNIHIIMILYDFCLLPAYFGYIVADVRNLVTPYVKLGSACALVSYQWRAVLHFAGAEIWLSATNSHVGQA